MVPKPSNLNFLEHSSLAPCLQELHAWRLQAHAYALNILVLEAYSSPRAAAPAAAEPPSAKAAAKDGGGKGGAVSAASSSGSSGARAVLVDWCRGSLPGMLAHLGRLDLHTPLLEQLLHITQVRAVECAQQLRSQRQGWSSCCTEVRRMPLRANKL